MTEDILLPFSLPSVQRKKVVAAFDGGRLTSDGGVMLLAGIETSLGIAATLAPLIADPRMIKLHKSQLASDRTSCRSPLANQLRLVLHTGAYWIMLGLRDVIPAPQSLARAEFTTLRMRLIKIGARIVETASRIRVAFAAAHPEAMLFASLARCLRPAGP